MLLVWAWGLRALLDHFPPVGAMDMYGFNAKQVRDVADLCAWTHF